MGDDCFQSQPVEPVEQAGGDHQGCPPRIDAGDQGVHRRVVDHPQGRLGDADRHRDRGHQVGQPSRTGLAQPWRLATHQPQDIGARLDPGGTGHRHRAHHESGHTSHRTQHEQGKQPADQAARQAGHPHHDERRGAPEIILHEGTRVRRRLTLSTSRR